MIPAKETLEDFVICPRAIPTSFKVLIIELKRKCRRNCSAKYCGEFFYRPGLVPFYGKHNHVCLPPQRPPPKWMGFVITCYLYNSPSPTETHMAVGKSPITAFPFFSRIWLPPIFLRKSSNFSCWIQTYLRYCLILIGFPWIQSWVAKLFALRLLCTLFYTPSLVSICIQDGNLLFDWIFNSFQSGGWFFSPFFSSRIRPYPSSPNLNKAIGIAKNGFRDGELYRI